MYDVCMSVTLVKNSFTLIEFYPIIYKNYIKRCGKTWILKIINESYIILEKCLKGV